MSEKFDVGVQKPHLNLVEATDGVELQIRLHNGAKFLLLKINDDGVAELAVNKPGAIGFYQLDQYIQIDDNNCMKIKIGHAS